MVLCDTVSTACLKVYQFGPLSSGYVHPSIKMTHVKTDPPLPSEFQLLNRRGSAYQCITLQAPVGDVSVAVPGDLGDVQEA